ncbi:Imm1 family immunity protein [Longispora sp. NPDC051575]|uniref:Imm1 family immunity protein n=1 Tax=Longispora sp. NPDC051575 TaxID=3154943 RepID=UPI0034196A8A
MSWCPSHDTPLAGPEDAAKAFDRWSVLWQPWGKSQVSMYFGPLVPGLDGADEWDSKVLRVDADFEVGRAAVTWLPDGSYGVELGPTDGPITAGFGEPEEIPAERARVSVEKAREAIIEYVTTGDKPVCLRWEAS